MPLLSACFVTDTGCLLSSYIPSSGKSPLCPPTPIEHKFTLRKIGSPNVRAVEASMRSLLQTFVYSCYSLTSISSLEGIL